MVRGSSVRPTIRLGIALRLREEEPPDNEGGQQPQRCAAQAASSGERLVVRRCASDDDAVSAAVLYARFLAGRIAQSPDDGVGASSGSSQASPTAVRRPAAHRLSSIMREEKLAQLSSGLCRSQNVRGQPCRHDILGTCRSLLMVFNLRQSQPATPRTWTARFEKEASPQGTITADLDGKVGKRAISSMSMSDAVGRLIEGGKRKTFHFSIPS